MLLRFKPGARLMQFVLVGAVLGISYWVKTVMFPLGLVVLAVAYLWRRSTPGWARGIGLAALIFWCICVPLIFLLSVQKGRFTFGDSGRNNYAWFVAPRTSPRNWQGQEPGSGTPVHPTRQLLKSPPVFEFDGPVVGTYPPWTDPTHWNEGLKVHFDLKRQFEVLKSTIPAEVNLLLRKRPELVPCVLILCVLGGSLWVAALRELWVFIVLPAVSMAFYLPLVVNDRYLGFVLVLFLVLLSAVRFRTEDERVVRIIVVATFIIGAGNSAIHHSCRESQYPGWRRSELNRRGLERGGATQRLRDDAGNESRDDWRWRGCLLGKVGACADRCRDHG
jgi:hypothetical protein